MICGIMKSKKLVFVTGAAKGIGRAIADRFLCNGYRVAYGYFHTEVTADSHPNMLAVPVDIQNRDSVIKAISHTEKHFGASIDILVNNAGIAQEKDFLTITEQDWQTMLNTNLGGAFRFTQEILPAMIKKRWGRIINISSIGGQWGGFNQVHYAAAKAALINFTMSLAKLYSKDGITANAIAPGLIETDMIQNEIQSPAGKEKCRNIPAGRIGTSQEVAAAVLFLACEEAGYITGQTININGGMYFG